MKVFIDYKSNEEIFHILKNQIHSTILYLLNTIMKFHCNIYIYKIQFTSLPFQYNNLKIFQF